MSPSQRLALFVLRALSSEGTLELTLPEGSTETIGSGDPVADLTIRDPALIREISRQGITGFAEAYMAGALETSDLRRLVRWGMANERSWFEHPLARAGLPLRRLGQRIRPERRHRKVRSMGDHYDLGNDFYAAWLDETMTYSSARFADPQQLLSAAQQNKYRLMADHAGLEPGMRVLEIGCGWGGFAEYAASERQCRVVALTLSEEQASYSRKRMADAGVTEMVDIQVQDFRDAKGVFDGVVSIEMIESIDETQWPDLFDKISTSLDVGRLAAMQVITTTDGEWERYRSRADFIQQYIFPGGQLPAPSVIRAMSAAAGLSVEQVETFGLDYARTLSLWRDRFLRAWPDVATEHDLDERFRRMWDLYLTLCEAGFRIGRIGVEQWVFRRAGGQETS